MLTRRCSILLLLSPGRQGPYWSFWAVKLKQASPLAAYPLKASSASARAGASTTLIALHFTFPRLGSRRREGKLNEMRKWRRSEGGGGGLGQRTWEKTKKTKQEHRCDSLQLHEGTSTSMEYRWNHKSSQEDPFKSEESRNSMLLKVPPGKYVSATPVWGQRAKRIFCAQNLLVFRGQKNHASCWWRSRSRVSGLRWQTL